MKIFNLKIFLAVLIMSAFYSCGDDEVPEINYQDGGTVTIADPYLQILTPVVAFQAGTPDYTLAFNVINGTKNLSKINVYSVYTDAATGAQSSEVLFKSYTIGSDAKSEISDKLTYADLKKGITVNGSPLSDDQTTLPVGSGWKFRFEGETSKGIINLAGNVNVGVLSRFAGLYTVTASKYYRINVLTAEWTGQTRFIGSVDDNTFSYNDWWGSFAWAGSSFRFRVDFATNKIKVPILVNGALFSGNRAMDCEIDDALFVEQPCSASNVLVPDEVNGKHILKLTYGYFTNGSGPRAFYEELQKI